MIHSHLKSSYKLLTLCVILLLFTSGITCHNFQNIDKYSGYRFVICGDFDGDGTQEKLIEHYVSQIDGKETAKFPQDINNYDSLITSTLAKKPLTYMVSNNSRIDTLMVSSSEYQFGILFAKNEGDLDGDGGDELSFVVNAADYSSVNTCYLYTYKKGLWIELYSFSIWEWLFPDLPGTNSDYGLFGLTDQVIIKNDSITAIQEQNLRDFKGLIQKKANHIIEVIHKNEEAEKVKSVVDLKTKKIQSSSLYN